MAETHAAALREFLLSLERLKQPLDAAFRAFTELMRASPATAARFLAIHPQCEPVLHCWPEKVGASSRWEQRESVAVFLEALALLLRAQTARDASAAEALALKVIRDRSAHLEKVMTWSDKPLIEFRALELVRAIVVVSGAVAREFVRLFNLQSPAFAKMATRRFKKPEPAAAAPEGGDDDADKEEEEAVEVAAESQKPAFQIREAYVALVLELTACPDKSVHRFALKEGGLAVSLFKSVDGDSPELLALIFDKLEELVLRNTTLDFRAKIAVWSGANILQLLPLLQSDEDQAVERTAVMLDSLFFADDALYEVRPAADAFRAFLVKPTSAASPSSQGAMSFDQSVAFKTIKSTVVAIGVNELLRSPAALGVATKFMTKYPSLSADYLAALSIPLEPRPAYRWFCVASLLQKLLSCSIRASAIPETLEETKAEGSRSSWCSPQLIATRLIAPCNYKKELSRGIQHANNLVVYSTLGVMEAILHRFACVVTHLMPSSQRTHSELESELRFLLPSPEALVSLLLKLCGAAASSASQQAAGLIYVRALSVFRLYVECFPQTMREVKLDFTKLLTWQYFADEADDEAKMSLQSMIVAETLRFLLVVDTKRLPFLLQRSGSGASGSSKLLQLLLLDVNTPSRAIQQLCDRVITRVLLVSGVFGRQDELASGSGENEEIAFWLQSLHQGGQACAQFVEELVQSVASDPFASVALYHAHLTRATGAKTEVRVRGGVIAASPIAIALVAFLNESKNADGSDWRTTYRRDATVVMFAVRVLLSVLHSAGPDARPLAALIASDATNATPETPANSSSEINGDESEAAGRKRKRAGAAHVSEAEAEDAYSWLKAHCKLQLALALPSGGAAKRTKKAKVGKSNTVEEDYTWKTAASVAALRLQLASLPPGAFGSHWEAIVGNCSELTGSFDLCHHYLLARADADLMPVLSASTSGAAKKKVTKAGGSATHPFAQTLSPAIILQHVLYRMRHGSSADEPAVLQLIGAVKQRAHSKVESLAVDDALHMCDQLYFFLAMDLDRGDLGGKGVPSPYKSLCELLQLLLALVMASAASSTRNSAGARRRIARLERLLVQYSSASTVGGSYVHRFVWRQLVAARLIAATFLPLAWDDADSTEATRVLTQSAMVPLLVVGALHTRSSKQPLLTVLDSLLARQHRRRRPRHSAQHILVARTIQNLSSARDRDVESKLSPTSGALVPKLWRFLAASVAADNGAKICQQDAVEVLRPGFELLGRLGGVDANSVDIQSAIDSTIVPAVVNEATLLMEHVSGRDSTLPSLQLLQRVVRAMRVSEADGGVPGFAGSLEARVLARLQSTKDERVSCAVVASVFDVFGRVRSSELRAFVTRSLIPRVVEALLFHPSPHELTSGAANFRVALLRHWIASELSHPSDQRAAVDALTHIFGKLSAAHPKGAVMSRAQLYCVLVLARSWCENTSFSSASSAPSSLQLKDEAAVASKLVVFMARSAALSLSAAGDAAAAKESCEAAGLVVEQFLTRTRLLDARAAAKGVASALQDAAASIASTSDRRAFQCFVALSGALLRLAAASPEPPAYDFAAHLTALTEHASFALSLQDESASNASARVLLVRVLAGLVERSGVYRPSLFGQLLAAYNMTLSPFDRRVRALVARFERQQLPDVSLARVGFRFGASCAASTTTAAFASTARADLVEDAQWIVRGGLEVSRVRATVEHFPLDRDLDGGSDEQLLSWRSSAPIPDVSDLDSTAAPDEDAAVAYDPAYLLPMLAHFVAASALAEDALVQTGLLGLALRATSARDERVREHAYAILAHVHEALTAEATASGSDAFRAGRQVHLLLDAFRRALGSPLQRAPSLVTVFLNDALSILTRPAHAMYASVNAFFLARPALDLLDVPMFYALFNSRAAAASASAAAQQQQYKQERAWLLHSLRRGVRDDQDVQLLARRHALSLLLSFLATPALADEHTQTLVLQVLLSVARAPAGRALLVTKCAAIEWAGTQLARVATPLLAPQGSRPASASASSVSVLLLLLALLRRLIEDTEWADVGSAWTLAAGRQTANALAAAVAAVAALRRSSRTFALWTDHGAALESALAGVSQAAVNAFALSLPLAALELAVESASTAGSTSSVDAEERAQDAALSLAETLLGDARALAQHPEWDARRLPRWKRLLDAVADSVTRSVPAASNADGAARVTPGRLARAKRVLASADTLAEALPALRSS